MHEQEILEALKAKFTGVDVSILSRVAKNLAKTITTKEQIATAVEGVTFQKVLESYGDSRATEAQQTAVRNYETKHGLKDGVKIDQQPPKEDKNEDVPSWAQSILDANKKLNERLDKMDSERTTTTRKQQLDAIIDKLPDSYKNAYKRISVESMTEEEFNSLVGEINTEVENIMADVNAKGAVFGRPARTTGGGSNDGNLTEEQLNAISTRTGSPKEGQPF